MVGAAFDIGTEMGKDFVINEGDGAFYGPKLDFHLSDSLGRTWQCGTIQLDMQLPERFELEYTGADGEKHRPVMIHRVVLGSIERFIGVITEHFAGAFPTWLAPEQVRVMPMTDRNIPCAQEVMKQLTDKGFRATMDERNEKIGKKIRETTRYSFLTIGISSILITAVSLLLGQPIIHLFVEDGHVFDLTWEALKLFSPVFLFIGWNVFLSGYFTELGNGPVSALISSLRSLILVVAFILILPRIIGVTAGIWLTMPLSEIVTVFVALYLYRTYGKQYMLEG